MAFLHGAGPDAVVMADVRVRLPLRPAPRRGPDWHGAACRDADPELFFPVGDAGPALVQLDRARQVCAGCAIRTACLEWALASGEVAGVWGGASEDERRALRRMRHALPAPGPGLPPAQSAGVTRSRNKRTSQEVGLT